MPTTNEVRNKTSANARRGRRGGVRAGARLRAGDTFGLVRLVRSGFPYRRCQQLQKSAALPLEELADIVGIPMRTLLRRKLQGRLHVDESDRVLRASTIFDQALALFEGDKEGTRRWMRTPQPALAGESPWEMARTEVGAREVERFIQRLEDGVFS